MPITTHPDARARVTKTFYSKHMGVSCSAQLVASCGFSLKSRGSMAFWDSDFSTMESRITGPAERPTFPWVWSWGVYVPGALITPDRDWNSPLKFGWMFSTNNKQNKCTIALQWLFRLQGHLCWLELGVFDSTPEIHKGKYLCLFLCLSLTNKGFWCKDFLNSSWNSNDWPGIFTINLTEQLSTIKRHPYLPPHQAGNMIDSVNLHQAISDILDPLLPCD